MTTDYNAHHYVTFSVLLNSLFLRAKFSSQHQRSTKPYTKKNQSIMLLYFVVIIK
jgi:hypothetical protein